MELKSRRPPGPPRDRRLRQLLENHLIANRNRIVSRRELQTVAEAFTGKTVSRQNVKNWYDFLTQSGFLVEGRARLDVPEQLFLLLLDVPTNAKVRARVDAALAGNIRGEPEAVAGIFNLLVRVPGRSIAVVEQLAAACIAQGALDARALVNMTAMPRVSPT